MNLCVLQTFKAAMTNSMLRIVLNLSYQCPNPILPHFIQAIGLQNHEITYYQQERVGNIHSILIDIIFSHITRKVSLNEGMIFNKSPYNPY